MSSLREKIAAAAAILRSCIGTKGVWADPSRYRFQCWTRDFVVAIMPVLLESGETGIIKTHLENLSRRQRPNGQIPILFLDRILPFLSDKLKRSWRDGKISFMLRRFLVGQVWNLTPGTKDSEILYIIGMHEYANSTGDRSLVMKYSSHIRSALDYIEGNLMRDGLVVGCDWRDTMHIELGNKSLLTNNSLLYHAYRLMGETRKAEQLRQRINEQLWIEGSYLDYSGSNRFDPLGGAFAVLYDVIPQERYVSVAASFHSVDTSCGVAIKCRHNPVTPEEREVIERTDGVVVWPFVVGFSILALIKMGERAMAEEQFEKLLGLEGFREWYDPANGKGYGALEQLWSATLFLRAAAALDTE
jgi:glycogen debranching enzyme